MCSYWRSRLPLEPLGMARSSWVMADDYGCAMDDVAGCVACDLSSGRQHLPGGIIWSTERWRVEHCVGPLGVGTLLVKPVRHVEHVADLNSNEAGELGALLQRTTAVVGSITGASQVYVCLWSHRPSHVHFVIQPETEEAVARFGVWGPSLQSAMFERDELPDEQAVDAFAQRARDVFQKSQSLAQR
jgi:diadenosine tetraphosphate (Ap4A) HIT family hydrolase